jgi:serine/threonine protein kinase
VATSKRIFLPKKGIAAVYKSAFNEYTVVRPLGNGGAGTVYEVSDTESLRYALKAIDLARSTSQKLRRFKNETTFCLNNRHKNIITVVDYGRGPSGEPFYVMPKYALTLQKVVTQGINPTDVLPIFSQVLDGVEAAHLSGVTHRDLKPQNILCNLETSTIVVADFGIASFEEDDLYTAVETHHAERLANFQYAAPEQRARGKAVTSKADIYALGLILNEMFTGEVPQGTGFKSIASFSTEYSYLDTLIEQMMRQDPEQRPTIGEIKKQLVARRQQFVSLQKIDHLTHEVVPEGTVDDPLVRHPVTLESVDYQSELLLFTLSRTPNAKWINQFHRLGNITSFVGLGPGAVEFQGSVATIPTRPQDAQAQVVYFKDWLEKANDSYRERISKETEELRREQERKQQSELAAEHERQEVLRKLKW